MNKISANCKILLILLCLLGALGASQPAVAETLSATAVVEKQAVYLGEPFIFQIQVEGNDVPDEPDVSAIKNFHVLKQGGQQNSNSSVTIINGRVVQNVQHGYVFTYKLTAEKTGHLTIPAIRVSAAGQTTYTHLLTIKVVKPIETNDFKLRLKLSSAESFVGQPVNLTLTWYIGKNVEEFQFNLPVLTDSRFDIADIPTSIDPNQKDRYLRIPVNGGDLIGEKVQGTLDGKEYLTVRFRKILIPRQTGIFALPQATVAFKTLSGYKDSRRQNSMFGDFFNDDFFSHDFFSGRRQQTLYKNRVIPSNEPVLTVKELPQTGQPPHFNGLVGKYKISASAVPTEVRVGDPITLTLQVTGPDYLKNVELTPLHQLNSLNRDFKIPKEMAAGKVDGSVKTFTQTLRAKYPLVKAIPSIELSYFDVKTGKYAITRSDPIPLKVSAARIVTAKDAEGQAIPENAIIKTGVEKWKNGIAYNYEDQSVLKNQAYNPLRWISSPLWMMLVGIPPLVYFILLILNAALRSRNSNPEKKQAQRAYDQLLKIINHSTQNSTGNASPEVATVLDALRYYLGSRLNLPAGAFTYNEIKEPLKNSGVTDETTMRLKQILEDGDARRYSGDLVNNDTSSFTKQVMALAITLERSLR